MILVTGGAGFIGSNIVAALCERGVRVAVCDRLRDNDKWRNLAKSAIRELIHPDALEAWLAEYPRLDGVIHMGAISSTTERDVDLIFDVNVRLSQRLWEWCASHGTPFIYASSAATYGAGDRGFDDDQKVTPLPLLRPLNAYGWSKHFFDTWVVNAIAAGKAAPPHWAGLKFFNVYGPNEYHKRTMQSVVAQKFAALAAGEPVGLFTSHHPDYADGGQMRDFIYVDDCVDVVLWLLDNARVTGLFNLGTGEARSFSDLVRAMAVAAAVPLRIEFTPMPDAIRPNYQYFTQASTRKLRDAGYGRHFTSLEDGVRQYVEGYLANADRYR